MPLKISTDELQSILTIIDFSDNGASISELMTSDNLDFKRRTLQRRLDLLCKRGQIIPRGNGRGRRYLTPKQCTALNVAKQLKDALQKAPEPVIKEVEIKDQDWLSTEAREIRRLVTLPPSKRRSAAYNATFLSSYQPNVTFYLPQPTREQLAEMGKSGLTNSPSGTYIRQILDRFLIDLAWNSSRLDGNTYSFIEAERLLELGKLAEANAPQEAQMILNHKTAIQMLANPAEAIGFNPYTVCNLHALLSDNLMSDPNECGSLRARPVAITESVFHPLEIPEQIEDDFLQILYKASDIEDPFEASFFMMVHLSYLQAFERVNRSVARLASNIPMILHNVCPISFADVETDDYHNALTGIYELQRIEYLRDVFVWAYSRSTQRYNTAQQKLNTPDPFRLKYRNQITKLVRKVVQTAHSQTNAQEWINHHANIGIPEEHRNEFIDTIKVELASLHEGNIARYQLRPADLARWSSHLKRN